MKNAIKNFMDIFERNSPEHREHNDRATEDLFVGSEISPGKPFALDVGYALDRGHHNRDFYRRNYDNRFHPNDRAAYDEAFQDMAEKVAMLHDPAFILDESDYRPSEDRDMAREILHYLIEEKGVEEAEPLLLQELFHPMLKVLLDRLVEAEETIDVLSESMIADTPHKREDYAKRFKAHILNPAVQDHPHRWKNRIREHFGKQEVFHG